MTTMRGGDGEEESYVIEDVQGFFKLTARFEQFLRLEIADQSTR